jgi:hypothetical protein
MASKESERLKRADRLAEREALDLRLRRELARELLARKVPLNKAERAAVSKLIEGEEEEKRQEALRQAAERLPQKKSDRNGHRQRRGGRDK